jgi:hypothetical protein
MGNTRIRRAQIFTIDPIDFPLDLSPGGATDLNAQVAMIILAIYPYPHNPSSLSSSLPLRLIPWRSNGTQNTGGHYHRCHLPLPSQPLFPILFTPLEAYPLEVQRNSEHKQTLSSQPLPRYSGRRFRLMLMRQRRCPKEAQYCINKYINIQICIHMYIDLYVCVFICTYVCEQI